MDAVISDIHGNVEALDAVLDEIGRLRADRIICLGDLVGYGPDSAECLRRSADWDILIAGDWDYAVLDHDPGQWNPFLNREIQRVCEQIRTSTDSAHLLKLMRSFQRSHLQDGWHFTHATPADVHEFHFPEDIYCLEKLNRLATQLDIACVVGHTHYQCLFERNETGHWTFVDAAANPSYELLPHHKILVNAGSVGQPRDGDSRAAFVTIDGATITFHRVEYDIRTTIAKIHSNPLIDNMHGDRLLVGR